MSDLNRPTPVTRPAPGTKTVVQSTRPKSPPPKVPVGKTARPSNQQIGEPRDFLAQLVKYTSARNGSDVHLRVKNHPTVRIDGVLKRLPDYPKLTIADMENIAQKVMSPRLWDQFQDKLQVDLSVGLPEVGRVRVNAYYQRGTIAMALRIIQTNVPKPSDLGLPDIVSRFVHFERGLVILTGATGSGKSSTIASLIGEIDTHYPKHIITIEDPIEFLFKENKSLISQRELGADATTFADAMTAALREDPDVILLGEMRNPETIDTALTAAETGHLVFSTLHAPATAETITRIISSFSPEAQPTLRAKLAQNLRAVIAQRLLPHASGQGRVVACEIMTVNARVRELILDPIKVKEIGDMVKKGAVIEGMLSFDQNLFELCRRGEITEDVALQHASSPTDLKLMLDGFVG